MSCLGRDVNFSAKAYDRQRYGLAYLYEVEGGASLLAVAKSCILLWPSWGFGPSGWLPACLFIRKPAEPAKLQRTVNPKP